MKSVVGVTEDELIVVEGAMEDNVVCGRH